MPSGSEEDDINFGQTYQDLVRAEQTASELEARLDNLDDQLEALIRASNLPPELFSMDEETLKETLEAASAKKEKQEEAMQSSNNIKKDGTTGQANGTEGRHDVTKGTETQVLGYRASTIHPQKILQIYGNPKEQVLQTSLNVEIPYAPLVGLHPDSREFYWKIRATACWRSNQIRRRKASELIFVKVPV
ncbi:hypothetical protein TWF128_010706 [Orbilia oligospora]|nr:hypothetical protein TWF128_010706 [Orbilia oligospora]